MRAGDPFSEETRLPMSVRAPKKKTSHVAMSIRVGIPKPFSNHVPKPRCDRTSLTMRLRFHGRKLQRRKTCVHLFGQLLPFWCCALSHVSHLIAHLALVKASC